MMATPFAAMALCLALGAPAPATTEWTVGVPATQRGLPVVEAHLAVSPVDPSQIAFLAMEIHDRERPFASARAVLWRSEPGSNPVPSFVRHETEWLGYDPWVTYTSLGHLQAVWLGDREQLGHQLPIRVLESGPGAKELRHAATLLGSFDGARSVYDARRGELIVLAARFDHDETETPTMRARVQVAALRHGKLDSRAQLEPPGQLLTISPPVVSGTGALLFVTVSENDQAEQTTLWRSVDGGNRFVSKTLDLVADRDRRRGLVQLAADPRPRSNRLYLARVAGGSDSDRPLGLWFSIIDAAQLTARPERRIDAGGTEPDADLGLVSLAVDPSGRIGVSWLARQLEGWGLATRPAFTYSRDEGSSFAPVHIVDPHGSDPRTRRHGRIAADLPWGGHYAGLAAQSDGAFLMIWNDARSGVFSPRLARLLTSSR